MVSFTAFNMYCLAVQRVYNLVVATRYDLLFKVSQIMMSESRGLRVPPILIDDYWLLLQVYFPCIHAICRRFYGPIACANLSILGRASNKGPLLYGMLTIADCR